MAFSTNIRNVAVKKPINRDQHTGKRARRLGLASDENTFPSLLNDNNFYFAYWYIFFVLRRLFLGRQALLNGGKLDFITPTTFNKELA